MPRKKRDPFSAINKAPFMGELLASAVNLALQDLPPTVYAFVCKTSDQKTAINSTKAFYKKVGAILEALRTGDAQPDYSDLHKHERELLNLEVRTLLDFYLMVSMNWKPIRRMLVQCDRPPVPATVFQPVLGTGEVLSKFYVVQSFRELKSPRDVLLEMMRYRAIRQIIPFFVSDYRQTAYQVTKTVEFNQKSDRFSQEDESIGASVQRSKNAEVWLYRLNQAPESWLAYKCAHAALDDPIDKEYVDRYFKTQDDFDSWFKKMARSDNGSKLSLVVHEGELLKAT